MIQAVKSFGKINIYIYRTAAYSCYQCSDPLAREQQVQWTYLAENHIAELRTIYFAKISKMHNVQETQKTVSKQTDNLIF